jgi:hypothetical protein
MRIPAFLRGPYVVARQEFLVNLRSIRHLIMLIVLALLVVGGAYGLGGGLGSGGPSIFPFKAWGHPAIATTGENEAVVWVSDPFGQPLAEREVSFHAFGDEGAEELGQSQTDANGFARLLVGNRTEVGFTVRSGTL